MPPPIFPSGIESAGESARLSDAVVSRLALVSMPTQVNVEFGFTDNVGDDGLAGFTLGQMLFERCCPTLPMGKTLTRFRFPAQPFGETSTSGAVWTYARAPPYQVTLPSETFAT